MLIFLHLTTMTGQNFFSPIHLPVIFDAYNTEIILNLPALHALPVFLDRLQQFGIILKEITGHGRFR